MRGYTLTRLSEKFWLVSCTRCHDGDTATLRAGLDKALKWIKIHEENQDHPA